MKFKNLFVAVALLMVLNLFGGIFGSGQAAKAENAIDPVYDPNAIALSQDVIKRAEPAIITNENDLTVTVNSRTLYANVGDENARIILSHIEEYNALTREQRANGETYTERSSSTSTVKGGFNFNGGCSWSAKLEWHWWGASVTMNHCLVQAIVAGAPSITVESFINWMDLKGYWGHGLMQPIMIYNYIYSSWLNSVDKNCNNTGATFNASYFTLPFGWVTGKC